MIKRNVLEEHFALCADGLEKSIPLVNFIIILWAAFAPISFQQKTTNPSCLHIKGAYEKAIHKMLVKCYLGSISSTFYESSFFAWKSFLQLFSTYILGLFFFGTRKSAQKAARNVGEIDTLLLQDVFFSSFVVSRLFLFSFVLPFILIFQFRVPSCRSKEVICLLSNIVICKKEKNYLSTSSYLLF